MLIICKWLNRTSDAFFFIFVSTDFVLRAICGRKNQIYSTLDTKCSVTDEPKDFLNIMIARQGKR